MSGSAAGTELARKADGTTEEAVAVEVRERFAGRLAGWAAILEAPVTTREEYEAAARAVASARELSAEIGKALADPIADRHERWKALTTLRANLQAVPAQVIDVLTSKLGAYDREQERKRREAEEAAAAAAARATAAAAEAVVDKAAELEAAGHPEAAEAMIDAAIRPGFPVVLPSAGEAAAPSGASRGRTYRAKVTDLRALARAVAEGTVPTDAIEAVGSFLDRRARGQKRPGALEGVPGVEVEEVYSYGRRRSGNGGGAVDPLDA